MPSNPVVGAVMISHHIIKLFRYLNIEYPKRLDYLFYSLKPNENLLGIKASFVKPSGGVFKRRNLSGAFEKYRLPSSYIINM